MPKIEATHPHVNCGTGTCRWAPQPPGYRPSLRRRSPGGTVGASVSWPRSLVERWRPPHYVIRGGLEGPRTPAGARARDVADDASAARTARAARRAVPRRRVWRRRRHRSSWRGLASDGFASGSTSTRRSSRSHVRKRSAAGPAQRRVPRRERARTDATAEDQFDVVYARFLLSHLPDPAASVANLYGPARAGRRADRRGRRLRPAMFCHPPSDAFQRFVDLYIAAVQARGADPNIGPRLPGLLRDAGLTNVEMRVVQPAGLIGRRQAARADHVRSDRRRGRRRTASPAARRSRASATSCGHTQRTDGTLASIPRVVQTWARIRADAPQSVHCAFLDQRHLVVSPVTGTVISGPQRPAPSTPARIPGAARAARARSTPPDRTAVSAACRSRAPRATS